MSETKSNGPKNLGERVLKSNLSPEVTRGIPQRSYVQSWLAVPRKTRLVLSCILFGTALGGLWVSDKLEENNKVIKHDSVLQST